MSWRGILSGSLVLVALQAALSSDEATTRVGRMFGQLADLSRRLIDPSVAAIPDLSAGGAGGATPTRERGAAGGQQQPQQQRIGGDDQDDDQLGPGWAPWNWDLPWHLPPGML